MDLHTSTLYALFAIRIMNFNFENKSNKWKKKLLNLYAYLTP